MKVSESGERDRHVISFPWNCYVEACTRNCKPQKMQPPTSCGGQSRFLEEAEFARQRGLTFQGKGMGREKHQRRKRPRTARSLVSLREIKEMRLRNSQRWEDKEAFMPSWGVWTLSRQDWGELCLRIIVEEWYNLHFGKMTLVNSVFLRNLIVVVCKGLT